MLNENKFTEFEYGEYFEINYDNIMIEKNIQVNTINERKNIGVGNNNSKKDVETMMTDEFKPTEKKLKNNEIEDLKIFLNHNYPIIQKMIEENIIISLNENNNDKNQLINLEKINTIDLKKYFMLNEKIKFIYNIESSSLCLVILEKEIDSESQFYETQIIILNYFKNFEENDVINIIGSITSISRHPKKNLCFAYGTNNGEIGLIDLELEGKIRMKSNVNEIFHFNTITNLEWIICKLEKNSKFFWISTSIDGRILLWDMKNQLKFPKKLYLLKNINGNNVGLKKLYQIKNPKKTLFGISNLNKLIYFEIETIFNDKTQNLSNKFNNESKNFLSNLERNIIVELSTNIELNNKEKKIIDLDIVLNYINDINKIYKLLNNYKLDYFSEDIYLSCFSYDTNLLLVFSKNNIWRIYDTINKKLLNYFSIEDELIQINFLSKKNDYILILNKQNILYLLNINDNKKIEILNYILSFEMINEGKNLLVITKDYKIIFYEISNII